MAVLGHDALGDVLLRCILIIVVLAVEEHDLVRVLLDGAGFAQIGQQRALVLAALVRTGQLRQAKHGHVQLLGHDLQRAGDVRNDLLAVFTAVAAAARADHELEIVDDDKAEIIKAAALGVHLRNGQRRIVVHADVRLRKRRGRDADLAPLLHRQLARDELLVVHKALVGDQARDELLLRHFEREKRHGLLRVLFRDVQRNVQCHGSLAHAGSGRQQHEVGAVEAIDELVKIAQAGGQARNVAAGLRQLLQAVEDLQQHRADVLERLVRVAAPQGIDALFRSFQDLLRRADALVDRLDDAGGRLGQIAQQRLVMDDLRIALDVRGRRRDLHELHEIFCGAFFVINAPGAHFIEHGDRVDDLRIAEHLVHRLIDLAVRLQVKILRADDADDVADAAAVNEHGAKHRLLGLLRMRRLPCQQVFHGHGASSLVLLLLDLHAKIGRDLIAELAADGIDARRLDRLVEHKLAAVELNAAALLERVGDFLRRDGAEQTSGAAALGKDGHGQVAHARGDGAGLLALALALFLHGLVVHAHGVDVIGRRLNGQLARQHVVAGVAVGDLDHLAALALAADILL